MMATYESSIIDERILSIKRVIVHLEKERNQLFDNRKQQYKQYKLIISEIKEAKQRIQKLMAMKVGV